MYRMLKRYVWVIPGLMVLLLPAVGLGAVQILEADDSNLRVLYEPGEMEHHQIETDAGAMDVVTFAECGVTGETGAPMLPVRMVLVGIPPDGDVHLQIIEAPFVEKQGYSIAPVPRMVKQQYGEEVFSVEEHIKDPKTYSGNGMLPEHTAQIGDPGFIRDQRVIPIYFYPLAYDPASGRILLYNRITVALSFTGNSPVQGTAKQVNVLTGEQDERLYSSIMLNYEQARGWRRSGGRGRVAVQESPFASGQWVKIKVESDGMYRITARELEEQGIYIAGVDSKSLRMYYGGGRELPIRLDYPRPELKEIAILVEDGGDGRFDAEDYLIFYGNDVSYWAYLDRDTYTQQDNFYGLHPRPWEASEKEQKFVHFLNHYTKENCYWLTWTPGASGKRMGSRDGTPIRTEVTRPSAFRARVHEEDERFSKYGDSGAIWYWETFNGNTRRYPSRLHTPAEGESTQVRVAFLKGRGQEFEISLGDALIDTMIGSFGTGKVAEMKTLLPLVDGWNYLQIKALEPGEAQFDWYEIEYARRFEAVRGELLFTSPVASGPVEFQISGFESPEHLVFYVSDPFDVEQLTGFAYQDGRITFQDVESPELAQLRYALSDQPQQYYALSKAQLRTVSGIELDEPSNLRSPNNGADFILITHGDFYDAAIELAQWRRESPKTKALRTEVVNVQDIYDEFSWGLFDPIAIRDFIKYAYEFWTPPQPMYVLLLGDGDYDLKNNSGTSPGIWIPPYEDEQVAIDDYFVCIAGDDRYPDLAIARIAVQTREEAQTVVRKIIDYEREPERGVWQNTLLFVGDDESRPGVLNELEHTQDTEDLAVNYAPRSFDQTKVYLMEYEKEGQYKPKAREDFLREFNRGVAMVNYMGHGNTDVVAHEHVFVASGDMSYIANGKRLPLFYLATCSAAHFDHPTRDTLTEMMVRRAEGGAVAAISATREAYARPNAELNKLFYKSLFETQQGGEAIGLALLKAKLECSDRHNSAKYILLGDPTLHLAVPGLEVQLAPVDSIRALDELKISGEVRSGDNIATTFHGQVYIKIYDSASRVYHITAIGTPIRYVLPGNLIFRGIFDVNQGRLDGYARIPKDISYNEHEGRISVFAWSDIEDGSGYIDDIYIGGTYSTGVADERGPIIQIGFRGQDFSDGDYIDAKPVLSAIIEDESGLNVTGEIGHEIELRMDQDKNQVYNVTDYFVSQNGYRKGLLEYPMGILASGEHTVELKAWDTFNNSSIAAAQVHVLAEGDFSLREVLCYPNPMTTSTTFTYQLSHPAEVTIEIYSISGRLIDKIRGTGQTGYNQNVNWVSATELANGVYLYKVVARRADGKRAEAIEHLVVMK